MKIRQRRWVLGMSQDDLSRKLGWTVREVRRGEAGERSLFASELWAIAAALEVPIAYLFDGLEGQATGEDELHAALRLRHEAIQLVGTYYDLTPGSRRELLAVARTLRYAAN